MTVTLPEARLLVEVEDMTLDRLCFEYVLGLTGNRRLAGKLRGYLPAVLDANPGLAALGPLIPRGQAVFMPLFTVEPQGPTKRLWD